VNGNALQIAARRIDQIGRGVMRLAGNAREKPAISRSLAEPFPDLMRERTAEIGMIEDRGRQRGAKERIAGQDPVCLTANRPPELIDGYKFVLDHGPSTPGSWPFEI
jgi:hypothetical protein